MCGFVTIALAEGRSLPAPVLQHMTNVLAHRGPDGFGYASVEPTSSVVHQWTDPQPASPLCGILFGHRRLSIIDLTTCGHQPMVSDDGSLVLAYNGEIYNFLELRTELEQLGCRFRGRSDTEVLLRAYETWGPAAFKRLNGMFAFTLWDGRRRTLVAARDRFGVKPLYISRVDGHHVFASEIKAILAFPGAHRGLNHERVTAFLANCLVDHDEHTLFVGVRALAPGTFLELKDGEVRTGRFWSLPTADPGRRRGDQEYIGEFAELLADAVRLRARSDVPIGTMLSGGLDSTSVTALIGEQKHTEARRAFAGLHAFHHTFSACWPGWISDEEAQVDLLCTNLQLQSHKIYPTPELLGSLLPRALYYLEEPFETPTALVQFELMRVARQHGVKVVLNGHGSDETLAGYPGFFVAPMLAQLLLTGRIAAFLRERRAFRPDPEWSDGQVLTIARLNRLLPKRLLSSFRGEVSSGSPLFRLSAQTPTFEPLGGGASMLSEALWLKLTRHILPMWLRAEDRVSMAWGVESRLPFLDYRLVEFAFRLPDDLKLRDGYTKFILRRAMRGKLPDSITLDRVKRRFATPYGQWFRGPWRDLVEASLIDHPAGLARYVDVAELRRRVQEYLAGRDDALAPPQLWRLLSTRLWLEQWENGVAAEKSREALGQATNHGNAA